MSMDMNLPKGEQINLGPKGTKILRDYLKEYLSVAPVSLAIVRAIECRLLSKLEFNHPILDIGCGDGLFASLFFKEQLEEGIDVSPEEISRARRSGAYKDLRVSNAVDLPYDDETFQTVFSNCVLEHIPPIDDVLKEISRVLKTDGNLIFTVPSEKFGENLLFNSFFRKIGLGNIGELYSKKFNSFFKHYNLNSPETWERRLETSGLKMVSCERYLSPGATKVHEITLIFGAPSIIIKKLFGRLIIFPSIRRYIVVPIIYPLLRGFYESDPKNGSSLLIVARKQV